MNVIFNNNICCHRSTNIDTSGGISFHKDVNEEKEVKLTSYGTKPIDQLLTPVKIKQEPSTNVAPKLLHGNGDVACASASECATKKTVSVKKEPISALTATTIESLNKRNEEEINMWSTHLAELIQNHSKYSTETLLQSKTTVYDLADEDECKPLVKRRKITASVSPIPLFR